MVERPFEEIALERGAVLGLLSAGYAVCAIVSILLFQFENGAAGVWLPNVFAVAILLRNPSLPLRPAISAVFIACLAANLLLGADMLASLLYTAANSALVLLEVTLIRKAFRGRQPAISSASDYILMLAAGGIVAPAIVAALFSGLTTGILHWPFFDTFWAWVVGEGLGFAVLLPILMTSSQTAFSGILKHAKLIQLVAAIGASIVISLVASNWTQLPFLMVIVPLMTAAAFLTPFEMAVASGSVGAALVALGVSGNLARLEGPGDSVAYGFQLSVAILAALPFVVGLVIEQMRQDRRRIAESEQRFRRAMEDSAIGVAIVGLDGRIVKSNSSFARMLGYTRPEIEALTFFQITHPDDVAIGKETMQRVLTGDADSYHFEKRYLHKDGTPIWGRLSGSVIRDPETGKPLHLVSQIEDIGARRRAEEAVAKAEARWSFALASAKQGLWDVDFKNGRVAYSSTWKQMLGYGEDDLDGDPGLWLTLVHPDDREQVEKADRQHVAGLTPIFEAEFRMKHRQGHWIWILDRGKVVERDENGDPLRAIGTLTDITARREVEDQLLFFANTLAAEKDRLRVSLDSIGDAVICTDAAMSITFMNPVAEKLTGVAESEALGKPLEDVYSPVDEETGEKIATAAMLSVLTQRVEHNSRAILSTRDGSRSIREVVSPILNDKGEFSGSVIVFQDFTDARALQRRLAHAAAHDPLTGLANRASLHSAVSSLVSTARPAEQVDLFLYIDLDNFKAVNDTGGHAAGDVVLKRVADTITQTARKEDFTARLGGDEFAIVLKSCSLEEGEAMAAQLLAVFGKVEFEGKESVGDIGASIGITAITHADRDVDRVMARADLACYRAKAKGRGCVVTLDGPEAAVSASKNGLAKAS